MEIHEKIERVYRKMNYEYTEELIQEQLRRIFAMCTEQELEVLYEEQLAQYEENLAHYENKPFIYGQEK